MQLFNLAFFCFFTVASLGLYTPTANAVFSGATNAINQVSGAVNQVGGVVNQVGDIADGISGIGAELNSITGGGGSTTTTTGTSQAGMFNPDVVFPAWGTGGQVTGVIGSNAGALNQGESRLIIYFIPKVIEILIWIVAPIVTVMFMYSGFIFIYAGEREEEVTKAKEFFKYGVIGITFIVLSYSLMKAVFFVIVQ